MLIAVRAEVEDVETWRQGFKTHGDLFKSQGVSVAYMGATDEKSVIGVFDTNDVDAFMRIFNDPATAEAMANDKICLLYTSPSPRDRTRSRMPSSA